MTNPIYDSKGNLRWFSEQLEISQSSADRISAIIAKETGFHIDDFHSMQIFGDGYIEAHRPLTQEDLNND